MNTPTDTLDLATLFIGLGGGLAIFLYGMRKMSDALKAVAGDGMKNLLASLTRNRFTSALAGTIITGVIQSSSVTTVLIVGFISAGLLNLNQSIGVIIGANIGTTITAQIIAFKVYKYGLLMVASGFFLEVLTQQDRIKKWGIALMGLGLIFFGMELMSNATGPLRSWPPFIETMQGLSSPAAGIMMGMIFTAVVQSSSATTGIVIVLASQGLISLESGIALLFGANIGTCITAGISAIGRPREAVQAAWVHAIFNTGGVLLWVLFIPQFADLIKTISPLSAELGSAQQLAKDTPRQIANAHTFFNIANAIIFIGFTRTLAKIVEKIVPKKPAKPEIKALYLDELYLQNPSLALDQVRRELVRMAQITRGTLSRIFHGTTEGHVSHLQTIASEDSRLDELHGEVIRYLGQLSQLELVSDQTTRLRDYLAIANDIETMGDIMQDNILHIAHKRLRLHIQISPITLDTLKPVYKSVCEAYDNMLAALEYNNLEAAEKSITSKQVLHRLSEEATAHLTKRLTAHEPNRVAAFKIETDLIEHFLRLNLLTRKIAERLHT